MPKSADRQTERQHFVFTYIVDPPILPDLWEVKRQWLRVLLSTKLLRSKELMHGLYSLTGKIELLNFYLRKNSRLNFIKHAIICFKIFHVKYFRVK